MHDRLLEPIEIGPRTLRNRIFISAHVPGFADQGAPGKRYISYHRQRAAAGVAMQITGGTAVHRSGLLTTAPSTLVNLDDTIVPGYQSAGCGQAAWTGSNSCRPLGFYRMPSCRP